MMPDPSKVYCSATTRSGQPCRALALRDGACWAHLPESAAGRAKGGRASSRTARAAKLLPDRLRPVLERLEQALEQVHGGELDPRRATAMATVARAIVEIYTAGLLVERVKVLEAQLSATEAA